MVDYPALDERVDIMRSKREEIYDLDMETRLRQIRINQRVLFLMERWGE